MLSRIYFQLEQIKIKLFVKLYINIFQHIIFILLLENKRKCFL